MSKTSASKNSRSSRSRQAIAIAASGLGTGFILFALGTGGKSVGRQEQGEKSMASAKTSQKPLRAWDMALGNMVVVAQELGFVLESANKTVDKSRIIVEIEGQLQSLRELYLIESDRHPMLMGSVIVQFTVLPSGEVTEVKEIASRVTDTEFKKSVLSEISKWSFPEIVSENVSIRCPLLFIRDGMDITTLIEWQKSLGR